MQSKPVRIQRSRQHKQISPNGLPIKYVGRGSKWGNPFRVVKMSDGMWSVKITDAHDQRQTDLLIKYCRLIYESREEAAKDAVRCYAEYTKDKDFSELKGHNLSCWCKIGETCHADFLIKIANI